MVLSILAEQIGDATAIDGPIVDLEARRYIMELKLISWLNRLPL